MADKSPSSTEKTKGIIEDVFRRADKNDDGSLSLEEFQAYFSDETLSKSQLNEIFAAIDTHKTNNIDIGELCEYFSKFWSPFVNLFAVIDDLNHAVTDCIHKTAQEYTNKTFVEQFATRFLMKEALDHIHGVESPLSHVNNSLEETAIAERPGEPDPVVVKAKSSVPRWQLKLERSISEQPEKRTAMPTNSLSDEVTRLSKLLDKLDTKVNFAVVEEERVTSPHDSLVLLVSYDLSVEGGDLRAVEGYIKQYVQSVRTLSGCIHVMVREYVDKNKFMIFEVWEDKETYNSYEDSVVRKTFKHACSECIKETSQFLVPDSWWPTL